MFLLLLLFCFVLFVESVWLLVLRGTESHVFWADAKGTGLSVYGPVQKVPAYVFLCRCQKYRLLCFETGAPAYGIFLQVYKAPAYVFVNRCENYWFMCLWAGEKVVGFYVC